MNSTQDYYNKYAKEYFEKTKHNIQIEQLNTFLKFINKEEIIFDLGCGSGNNLKIMKKRGYHVVGADNASALIEYARIFTDVEIYSLDMKDVNKINRFIRNFNVNHLYANASLLHITKQDFANFINKIKIPGYFYFSLKEGKGETFDKLGRFFAYYTREEVEKILNNRFNKLYFNVSEDYIERKFKWLNWISKLKSEFF